MHWKIFNQICLSIAVLSFCYGVFTSDAEVVFPKCHHKTQNGVHEEFLTYEIYSTNAYHVLDLKKVKKIPQESILLRTFKNKKEIISKLDQNGHYFRKIRDIIQDSSVHKSNIKDKLHAKSKRSIGLVKLLDIDPEYLPDLSRNKTLYVELFVSCDYRMLPEYNNNQSILIERVLNIIAQCDMIYQAINVRLVVVVIEIQENKDYFRRGRNSLDDHNYFEAYFQIIKNNSSFKAMNFDCGIFFRHENFDIKKRVHGLFCEEYHSIVHEWSYEKFDISGLSNLFGHLMGFEDENEKTDCACLTAKGCVMQRSISRGTGFSKCNIDVLNKNVYECLANYPSTQLGKICGNGIREDDEQCDCGTLEMCRRNEDHCCEPENCILKVDAQCSHISNPDCCQPNCYFKRQGTLCRDKVNKCDIVEYCSGDNKTVCRNRECDFKADITELLASINESSSITFEEKIGIVIGIVATNLTDRLYLNTIRDVSLLADILAQGQSIKVNVGESEKVIVLQNVLGLVNVVLDLDQTLILKTHNEHSSSNKFIETIDIMAQKYSKSYLFQNFVLRNIGMSNCEASSTDIYIVAKENSNKEMAVSIEKNFFLNEGNNDAVILIPKAAIPHHSLMYAVIYRNPYFFLNTNGSVSLSDSRSVEALISSAVVSVSIIDQTIIDLSEPISITFKKPKNQNGKFSCYFWNSSINAWSNNGCYKFNESNTYVVCMCNHLTNFALILDTSQIGYNPLELKVITWIGCGISIVTLLLTVLILLRRNLRKDRTHKIHFFMCVSLLTLLILFITAAERKKSSLIKCKIVAAGLHYFVLTTFCWMAVEGVNLYQKITVMSKLETRSFMVKSSLFAWGLPLPIVIYIGVVHSKYLGNSEICTVQGYPFYIGMLLPVTCIIVVNLIVLLLVIIKISKPKRDLSANFKDEGALIRFKKDVKNVFILSCLLGTTWVFALLAIGKLYIVFQWIFCITTSFQGFFLFLHHIALNPTAQNEIRFCMHRFFSSSIAKKKKDNSTAMTLLASKDYF
ncbi:adhesion G protein-coupled receptor L4-like isoform X2 [Hydra vulgaris]|uniref:Adhesion G protein-coupled receptor L4-like isoform X2 n=1 Tax=Hydra vulgaris TaxID=6087 RepID=A0ABM4CTT7_HYDVU